MSDIAEKELVEDVEVETPDVDLSETDEAPEPVVEGEEPETTEAAAEDDDGDLTIAFGDDAPEEEPSEETPVIRTMRQKLREAERERKALEKKLAERDGPKADALRAQPKLEDHDYDQDALTADLLKWADEKRAHDDKAKEATREWDEKVQTYSAAKAKLKAPDYADAEAAFMSEIDANRQGMLLDAVEQPALVILALGRNPDKLSEIAAITNPIKFAAALARLETSMKVGTRKAPAPERKVIGAAPGGTATQSNLAKLKEQAERTGDYSAYYEAKRAAAQ